MKTLGREPKILVSIYPKNFENWEFDKKAPQNFDLERVTIAQKQGASEDQNFEVKPTQSKPNFRSSLGIQQDQGVMTEVLLSLSDRFCVDAPDDQPSILEWLTLYAQKKQPTAFPFKLKNPPFTEQVLLKLQKIPFGKTTTYQILAKEIGNPKAARAVGNACGSNPFPLFIPCHRVLHTNGGLGGFSCGLEIKRRLLAFESNDGRVKGKARSPT